MKKFFSHEKFSDPQTVDDDASQLASKPEKRFGNLGIAKARGGALRFVKRSAGQHHNFLDANGQHSPVPFLPAETYQNCSWISGRNEFTPRASLHRST